MTDKELRTRAAGLRRSIDRYCAVLLDVPTKVIFSTPAAASGVMPKNSP